MNTFQRKVSAMERIALVVSENVPYMIELVIEIEGQVDLIKFRDAVAKAGDANPGTRCRLKGVLGFARWKDSGIAPEVAVIKDHHWDGKSERNAPIHQRVLEVGNGGPACEVLVLLGAPGYPDFIVFRASHALMDAKAALHWAKDVFRCMNGKPAVGVGSHLDDTTIKRGFKDQVKVSDLGLKCIPPFKIQVPDSFAKPSYIWRLITLPKTNSAFMFKVCTFAASYARQFEQGDFAVTIPVDLRVHREAKENNGNLVGYISLIIEADDTPKTLMRKLRTAMSNYEDCHVFPGTDLVHWIPLKWIGKFLGKESVELYQSSKLMTSGGVSSVTVHQEAQDIYSDDFKVKGIYGAPGFVGKINIVIGSDAHQTLVTIAVPEKYNSNGEFDQMISAFSDNFGAIDSSEAHQALESSDQPMKKAVNE